MTIANQRYFTRSTSGAVRERGFDSENAANDVVIKLHFNALLSSIRGHDPFFAALCFRMSLCPLKPKCLPEIQRLYLHIVAYLLPREVVGDWKYHVAAEMLNPSVTCIEVISVCLLII